MLAAKSFNPTSAPAQLDRWMRILAEELSHRLTEDGIAHSRAPRSLSLSYRSLCPLLLLQGQGFPSVDENAERFNLSLADEKLLTRHLVRQNAKTLQGL